MKSFKRIFSLLFCLILLAAFAIVLIVWLCGSGVADELHLFDVLSKKGGEG